MIDHNHFICHFIFGGHLLNIPIIFLILYHTHVYSTFFKDSATYSNLPAATTLY